jgi:alcohol dehydrogenase class IV
MLAKILRLQEALSKQVEQARKEIMTEAQKMRETVDKMTAATTKVGERINQLKEKIGSGMTEAEAEAARGEFEKIADHLTEMGTDPENPVPPLPEPETPPADSVSGT